MIIFLCDDCDELLGTENQIVFYFMFYSLLPIYQLFVILCNDKDRPTPFN